VNPFPAGFDLVTETVQIADLRFAITRPRSAEDLIDEAEYADDERLPYWADLWPSGRVLATYLAEQDLTGRRILEVGAGLSLPSMVAMARGASPLATDWYPQSLEFARANAHVAGLGELPTMQVDWSSPPEALFEAGSFDLVIGADVAYERRHASQLGALLARVTTVATKVLIADPRRPDASALVQTLGDEGWSHMREERRAPGKPDEQGPVIYLHHFRAPR
jgi:predicted nicotinamide N-methyase